MASRYALSGEYYAVEHPALENYLALASGHTFGLGQECTDCFHDEPSLADTLEVKGKSWKSYQEVLPQPCFLDPQAGNYITAYNPFLSFNDLRNNPNRCQQVVPLTQLDADRASGMLPIFAWITPNLVHDMHDGSVANGAQWLASFVPRLLASDAWKQADSYSSPGMRARPTPAAAMSPREGMFPCSRSLPPRQPATARTNPRRITACCGLLKINGD